MDLHTKRHPISKDYRITNTILGKGVDGNILLIKDKFTEEFFALKVNQTLKIIYSKKNSFKMF